MGEQLDNRRGMDPGWKACIDLLDANAPIPIQRPDIRLSNMYEGLTEESQQFLKDLARQDWAEIPETPES
jgi:hypothetical protein